MKRSLLLVEDEPGLVITLRDLLRGEGYEVETARDGVIATERAMEGSFDIVILDLMLPRKNGLDVCRDLRRQGLNVPILMLTARGRVPDKVVGLKLGADDYLTKPFDDMELLARIETLLRRVPPGSNGAGSVFQFGPVRVDLHRTAVWRDGKVVPLSAREFELLKYFIERRGAILSREELLTEVWGYDGQLSTRTVDVHVAWLRQKLETDPKDPQLILTAHGRGYQFLGD